MLSERPFMLANWTAPAVPVVISIPHAGRLYPPSLVANLALSHADLLLLEDRLVDCLAGPLIAAGYPVIMAQAPRAYIDCNRDPVEVDRQLAPDMPGGYRAPSAKMRAGLGLVPSRLPRRGPLWRETIGWVEVARRLSQFHQPYHAKIARQLAALRARFGTAILVDLHSMPPLVRPERGQQARIVIGTLHGQSCSVDLAGQVHESAVAAGFPAICDEPYPGGYTLATHGRPGKGVHALQVEIDRSLYLNASLTQLNDQVPLLAKWLWEMVDILAAQAEPNLTLAAE